MVFIHSAAVLLTLVALFGYLNYRFIRFPVTVVAFVVIALASLLMVLSGKFNWDALVYQANIAPALSSGPAVLWQSVLAILLFTAAIQINFQELKLHRLQIGVLAVVGTLVSILLVGTMLWAILYALAMPISFGYCLVFGVVMTPTESNLLLGTLRAFRLGRSQEALLTGESLLNNVLVVIVFLIVLVMAEVPVQQGDSINWLLQQIAGGLLWGLLLGLLTYVQLKEIEQDATLAIWITLGMIAAGLLVANWLELSAPLALGVAGCVLAYKNALADSLHEKVKQFWGVIAELLILVLVLLLGLELLRMAVRIEFLLVALAIIPVVILSRFVGVGLPLIIWQRRKRLSPAVMQAATWGALRGGIPIALILSLPEGGVRDLMLVLTYAVVILSLAVQGILLARVLDEAI